MDLQDIIGHEKQKQFFAGAAKRGMLSHGYVLTGPEHIGKTSFALGVAGMLGADPIMDTAVYDSPLGLDIAGARELRSRLALTPAGGKHKVGIVSYAENMNEQAASALLKLLEEPPARSVIFLISANFHSLLPTIVSRLQRIRMSPAGPGLIADFLSRYDLPAGKREKILEFSRGRIGLAARLAEDAAEYDFFLAAHEKCRRFFQGGEFDPLSAAEELAAMEKTRAEDFLRFAFDQWALFGRDPKHARRLIGAFREFRHNVNMKLMADNLFFT